MAQVTAAFGMGSPALSRTTARICSERPTRNCESSERICTMVGVWAAAVAAASNPRQARMPLLADRRRRQAKLPAPRPENILRELRRIVRSVGFCHGLLRKDFLHGAEAVITCPVDVVIAAARRRIVDRFGPIDSQRGVNGRGDVLRIDRAIAAPSRVSDRRAGC